MGRPWGIVKEPTLEAASRWIKIVERARCSEVLIPLSNTVDAAWLRRGARGRVTISKRESIEDVLDEFSVLQHDDMSWDDVDRFFDGVMVFLPARNVPILVLDDPDKSRVAGCDRLLFEDPGRFASQFYRAGVVALRHKLIVRIWP